MANNKYDPEQAIAKLRQIDVLLGQIDILLGEGKSIHQACVDAGITDVIYCRWRKEYGEQKGVQAPQLKDLQLEMRVTGKVT